MIILRLINFLRHACVRARSHGRPSIVKNKTRTIYGRTASREKENEKIQSGWKKDKNEQQWFKQKKNKNWNENKGETQVVRRAKSWQK